MLDDGGSIFWIFFGLQTSIYRPDLIILGEYNPDAETRRATDTDLAASWISTETIRSCEHRRGKGLILPILK